MSNSSEQLPENSEDSPQEEKENPRKGSEALITPSPLRCTPPLQGESLGVPKLEASAALVSQKTQGVKPSRDTGVGVLQSAAKKAARSNSRSDVHEYMRIRRKFV